MKPNWSCFLIFFKINFRASGLKYRFSVYFNKISQVRDDALDVGTHNDNNILSYRRKSFFNTF